MINADVEIDNKQVVAPWFKFNVTVTNNSDAPVVLVGFRVDVSGVDLEGNTINASQEITASTFNGSLEVGEATCVYEFENFDTIAAGDSSQVTVTDLAPEGSIPDTEDEEGIDCPPITRGVATFISHANPIIPRFIYSVKVTPIGYFGDVDNQVDRLDAPFTFKTR